MGMFDNIKISTDRLPVTDDEKKLLGEYHDWQTKDLENILHEYEITDNGSLVLCEPAPNIDKWFESKYKPNEAIPYTGFLRFYSYLGDINKEHQWMEFGAVFWEGKLLEIRRVEY